MKNISKKFLMLVLSLAMIVGSALSISPRVNASESRAVSLNGTVPDDVDGYLDSKALVVSTGMMNSVNYRITPSWSVGSANKVQVFIKLPSLTYEDGKYIQTSPDEAPSPLGIKAKVNAGNGWIVVGDNESYGGILHLEYVGRLNAGSNPAFDIELSTYTDGSDGIYGSMPEGITLEMLGWVSYGSFNDQADSAWETPKKHDGESIVKLIVSNLEWSTQLEKSQLDDEDPVPIWDRYQYASYEYSIKNDSDNNASLIEGFDVGFDINSNDIHINGIIPFDINRFKYVDGEAVENTDINDMSGQFIGVVDKGGILIYDITDWDTISDLDDPIPYRYTGSGSIMLEQSKGADRKEITPENASGVSERKYLLKLPLSRQGFPDLPTKFKVIGITNVKFAQGSNWSKTIVSEREITTPTYDFSFNHEAKQKDVVYGYDTHFTVSDFQNTSNVPIFNPRLTYTVDPDFIVDTLRVKLPENLKFEDYLQDRFLTYESEDVEDIILELPQEIHEEEGYQYFDLKLEGLNDKFTLHLQDSMKKQEVSPVLLEVHGNAYKVGTITQSALLTYIEKQASNDHLGQNTTYTDILHDVEEREAINIVYPKEVIPSVSFKVNGEINKDRQNILNGKGNYDEALTIDYYLGTKNEVAQDVVFKADINKDGQALSKPTLVLKKELFDQAEEVSIQYVNKDDVLVDLDYHYNNEDVRVNVDDEVLEFIVTMKTLKANGEQLISVEAILNKETLKTHKIQADLTTYQPLPYDQTLSATAKGIITITLPQELNPKNTIDTYYGDLKSQNVSYESLFDVHFMVDTQKVISPQASYTIDLLKASKNGSFVIKGVEIREDFVENVKYIDTKGNAYDVFDETKDIQKIVITYSNFVTQTSEKIVSLKVQATLEMGASQDIRGVFVGNQKAPFYEEKSKEAISKVTVYDTKTSVNVKGVNQVDEKLGVGNKYSVDIYRHWNRGYTYNTQDYTLDQGYKSLGGFTSSFTRPSATYANNDQTITVSTAFPDHFDLYYVKIRDEAKDYITSVNIYRNVDGEEVLWQEISGERWVSNTLEENYWRINTALYENDGEALFESVASSEGVYEHPYFKSAWHEDVNPQYPITKVDVVMDFERVSENDKPQMSGTHNNIFEFMGRFYKTSKAKEVTYLTSYDEYGKDRDQFRDAKTQINSLVGYSFAQSSTGAHDNTSLSLKQILMGTVGEYKASIHNKENFSVAYYGGHGPDIYIPAQSEHDEWLQMRDSGFFHDTLIYEFTYPNSPKQDAVYNYDAQYFIVEDTRVLKYLDKAIVHLNDKTNLEITADKNKPLNIRYEKSESTAVEYHDDHVLVKLKENIYPTKVEVHFKEIHGFGEHTAEIDGNLQDDLGNLKTVDIRIGGIVNGDKNLVGTTRLYRLQDDLKEKTLIHSSSATLKGITPKLNAQLSMTYDKTKVYDYKADGVTPSTSTVSLSIENKGEADISEAVINFKPDPNFRSQSLAIPKEIFDETWLVKSVLLDGVDVKEHFVLKNDIYVLDIQTLFEEGVLKTQTYSDQKNNYVSNMIRLVSVTFVSSDDAVRMFGSFTKAELEDDSLPSRLSDQIPIIVEGIWADQSESGEWDYHSKPSFVNSQTKASDEVITAYTDFNVNAHVTAHQTIFVSSGVGNQGEKPSLTHRSNANNAQSPRLYNRVSKLNVYAKHVDDKGQEILDSNLFYDEDTQGYLAYNNVAVGDTTNVLYRLENNGTKAETNESSGQIPVFNPYFEVVAPKGLKIKNVSLLENKETFINDEYFVSAKVQEENLSDQRYTVSFDQVLDEKESLYVLVSYETINDFDEDLSATQNKTMTWKAYAHPDLTHGFRSYNSSGKNHHLISGRTDVLISNMQVGEVSNTSYRYANPNQLKIKSAFKEENISGKEMTLTVSDIHNEIKHSNTELIVTVVLDEFKNDLKVVNDNKYGAFELTAFPHVETVDGYPSARVSFKYRDEWILVEEYKEDLHDLKDINELQVNYGIVEENFSAPNFVIEGLGHWKTQSQLNSKYYDISSEARLDLIHDESSQYSFATKDNSRVYKAIAKTELNIQAFDQKADAQGSYNGPLVQKHSYLPNETFYYKLSLVNVNHFQGLNTNTPYGKADFLKPVIFDKIPEYLSYKDFEIKIFDIHGKERDFIAPEITVESVSGLDVGGAQHFANNRHNDSYGLLSSAHPSNTTVNPAESINFDLVTFDFKEEDLKRGERLEIVYEVTARNDNLPYAKYKDDRAVWAPFFGWYGNNNPVGNSIKNTSMDMASLLHDVGVSGNKGHELTYEEFLSNSEAWTHGGTASRKQPSNTSSNQSTYYDESANKEKSHKVFMNEERTDDLHSSFNGGLDEVYNYLTKARVNDKNVKSDERIMWAQNGVQLKRAWLYGASEFRGNQKRASYGTDQANFYEHDGSLNHSDIVRHGYTPLDYDDYTYAVELHEIFSVRLHGVNLGDRDIESGLKYTEILPVGISPYDEDGNILGITAYGGQELLENITYRVIQTPQNDAGYRAPQQSQEAGSYKELYRDEVPYVVEVSVPHSINAWFKGDDTLKYQYVELKLRVEEEIEPNMDLGVHKGMSVWHDELRVSPIEKEEYLEIYSKEYGAYTRGLSSAFSQNAKYYKNDAVGEGFDLSHAYLSSTNYTTYLSFEPYGMYIRGLNAQNTQVDSQTLVTGDQIAMRKPTLRTWVMPEKVEKQESRYGNIDHFDVNIYDEMILHATIENQQLEVRSEYNRKNEGYNYYSGDNYNDDIWKNAPQTIGGAKGTYFEPEVRITLPKGVAPVLKDQSVARYYHDEKDYQDIDVTANVYDITGLHQTTLNRDVLEYFDYEVDIVDGQFVLTFTVNTDQAIDILYNQSLVISPRVKVIDNIEEDIKIEATSIRPVFTPIVSKLYTTGDTPSESSRDTNNKVLGRNNFLIASNDRLRKDSTSTYPNNLGYLKVSERLISASEKDNNKVLGSTRLRQRQASLYNDTKVMIDLSDQPKDLEQVDPAGKHWYVTKLSNGVIKNNNPSIESLTAGDIHHSRFTFTYVMNDFAKVTENYRIRIDDTLYTPEEVGYTVSHVKSEKIGNQKQKVIFIVTSKDGELLNSEHFEFLWEVLMVDGYEDEHVNEDTVWKSDDLMIESYVSVITDDLTVRDDLGRDFVIQDEHKFNYRIHKTDQELGFNANETEVEDYAYDKAEIEIIKPQLEIRKNTLKPRNLYSNGLTGDNYFKSIDDIEFLINHAEVVGSGVKEFVIEDILPTHIQSESSIQISRLPLTTQALYVSTGTWLFPDKTLAYIKDQGKSVEDYFKVFIYYSYDAAIDGYETENWKVLNQDGSSPLESKVYHFEEKDNPKKIRVVLKAIVPDELLIPSKTRLDVDANPETEYKERVTEVDPENLNITIHPDTVIDQSIRIGIRALSDASSTLFIYNTAQAWTNYVADKYSQHDQSETRSYLTPSRPVVNINHSAQYFKYDAEHTGDQPYGWSNNTTINPITLPHLKFKAEVVNADKTMWDEDENNAYEEDILIDPFITIQVPKVMESMQESLEYVDYESLDATHPLHDDYRNDSGLPLNKANGLWTWYLLRNGEAVATSFVKLEDTYTGPWANAEQNVLSFWFKGNIYPGDRLVVEYIGEVNAYTPGVSNNLKSIAMVSNNTGILSPLNSRKNQHNVLGYELDDLDYNKNQKNNDRLVFNEKSLFTYEKYDNFGKRKTVASDLNKIGTISPEATPVKEGGLYTYTITVDNSKDFNDNPYVYPIMYDVFPHLDDHEILNEKMTRHSKYAGEFMPDSVVVKITGKEDKTYIEDKDYTVYVGPFKKVNNTLVSVDLPQEITQSFFEQLNTPLEKSAIRDEYFVTLSDFKKLGSDHKRDVQSLLVMFNDKDYKLVGDSQIVVTYDMKARINAPVWLQESLKGLQERLEDYTAWNTFVATQKVSRFLPQESNQAGTYVTEQKDKTYLGSYVWHDYNYDGLQNEGELYIDQNGRQLLKPIDGNDPGINGVKVSLRTPQGYPVDDLGQAIHYEDGMWVVVDEVSGTTILDETFLKPIVSSGPLTTTTEDDYHGNAGYYIFSNIVKRDYSVVYEFPEMYDQYSLTTNTVFKDHKITTYESKKSFDIVSDTINHDRLVAITDPVDLSHDISDDMLMSFDLGVAQQIKVGGTIFKENLETLDGYQNKGEKGVSDYHIYVKEMDGSQAYDINGESLVTQSDKDGMYSFMMTPFHREYYFVITDENDTYTKQTVVTPFVHNENPFKDNLDNDAYTIKGYEEIRTNTLDFNLEALYESKFADRLSVGVGVYDKSDTAVIGNRVWIDENKNGLQDSYEIGIAHQELHLEQFYEREGEVIKTNYQQKTTSNADGYYYFKKVPTSVTINGEKLLAQYRVVIRELVPGYNITLDNVGQDQSVDNNFLKTGQFKEDEVIVVAQYNDNDYDFYEPVNDNTIDLGLHPNDYSKVSGVIFKDTDDSGLNTKHELIDENINVSLQVKWHNEWQDVYYDDGVMVSPSLASKDKFERATLTSNQYHFDNLLIVDSTTNEILEYRLKATDIPLWYKVSKYQVNDDPSIDSDYVEVNKEKFIEAETEAFVLNTLMPETLLGIDTFNKNSIEDVDLGLVPLSKTRIFGDRLWIDEDKDGLQGDQEKPIINKQVFLYELKGKTLVPVVNEKGIVSTVTDNNGEYQFEVELSYYDPEHVDYNKVREYLIVFNRETHQLPTFINTEHRELNSDVMHLSDYDYDHKLMDEKHTLVSRVADLSKKDKHGFVDYQNTYDDLSIDGGLVEYPTKVKVGGYYWFDENSDGIKNDEQVLENRDVVLQKFNTTSQIWEDILTEKTDEHGYYEFEVDATSYDRDDEYYLVPYRYRVKGDRAVNERWTQYMDKDVEIVNRTKTLDYQTGVSDEFDIFDEGDITSVRDDLSMGSAVIAFSEKVIVGGILWNDENEDGMIQEELPLEGRRIVLQEYVDDVWIDRESTITDEDGYYEFEVIPTSYDEKDSGYLKEKVYRAVSDREGYEAWTHYETSLDNTIQSLEKHQGYTSNFKVFEDGRIESAQDDLTKHIGILIYDHEVSIHGKYWEDTNEDGFIDQDEVGIEGRTVFLWKYDSKLQDYILIEETKTDDQGDYEFIVAATDYDVESEDYLVPYQYRISTERNGHEIWTLMLDDETLKTDNKISEWDQGLGKYEDITVIKNQDISSVEARKDLHIGIKTFKKTVLLGDRVTLDGKDKEGFKNAVIKLQVFDEAVNDWLNIPDINGLKKAVTDSEGYYFFEVAPLVYDTESIHYLQEIKYRTILEVPHGYTVKESETSQTPMLVAEGDRIILDRVQDDLSLDFVLKKQAEEDVPTGINTIPSLVTISVSMIGALVTLLTLRKRKNYEL